MGSSDSRTYQGPSGKKYDFYGGIYTGVKDPKDALQFLNAGNGTCFASEEPFEKIRNVLEKAVKKVTKSKEVDEENPPKETGVLEPTAEELVEAEKDIAPVDTEAPEKKEESKEELTEAGLVGLNRVQQVYLINQTTKEKIPRYESERVKLLLKIQKEGSNLVKLLKNYETK